MLTLTVIKDRFELGNIFKISNVNTAGQRGEKCHQIGGGEVHVLEHKQNGQICGDGNAQK